jgi:hypothetical protein
MTPKTDTLLGDQRAVASMRDGSTQNVTLRQLPIRALRTLADTLANGDEGAQIELFCGKPQGWSDNLTMDSAVALLQQGQALNEDFFVSWASRQQALAQRLLARMSPLSPSPTGAPTSPSPAA